MQEKKTGFLLFRIFFSKIVSKHKKCRFERGIFGGYEPMKKSPHGFREGIAVTVQEFRPFRA